jgi:hypothetical protein
MPVVCWFALTGGRAVREPCFCSLTSWSGCCLFTGCASAWSRDERLWKKDEQVPCSLPTGFVNGSLQRDAKGHSWYLC